MQKFCTPNEWVTQSVLEKYQVRKKKKRLRLLVDRCPFYVRFVVLLECLAGLCRVEFVALVKVFQDICSLGNDCAFDTPTTVSKMEPNRAAVENEATIKNVVLF
ncbi:hypothetical protein ABW19_dt0209949 [Dactylella cylindrospora]|nr:hypothetical protein ABW19_dt0209949 [Dactylella cylindrospora]